MQRNNEDSGYISDESGYQSQNEIQINTNNSDNNLAIDEKTDNEVLLKKLTSDQFVKWFEQPTHKNEAITLNVNAQAFPIVVIQWKLNDTKLLFRKCQQKLQTVEYSINGGTRIFSESPLSAVKGFIVHNVQESHHPAIYRALFQFSEANLAFYTDFFWDQKSIDMSPFLTLPREPIPEVQMVCINVLVTGYPRLKVKWEVRGNFLQSCDDYISLYHPAEELQLAVQPVLHKKTVKIEVPAQIFKRSQPFKLPPALQLQVRYYTVDGILRGISNLFQRGFSVALNFDGSSVAKPFKQKNILREPTSRTNFEWRSLFDGSRICATLKATLHPKKDRIELQYFSKKKISKAIIWKVRMVPFPVRSEIGEMDKNPILLEHKFYSEVAPNLLVLTDPFGQLLAFTRFFKNPPVALVIHSPYTESEVNQIQEADFLPYLKNNRSVEQTSFANDFSPSSTVQVSNSNTTNVNAIFEEEANKNEKNNFEAIEIAKWSPVHVQQFFRSVPTADNYSSHFLELSGSELIQMNDRKQWALKGVKKIGDAIKLESAVKNLIKNQQNF